MNIFQKLKLVNNIAKTVEEVKAVAQANSATGDKIQEIIQDLINILEKIKAVVPAVDSAIEQIIEIIKKWFKK